MIITFSITNEVGTKQPEPKRNWFGIFSKKAIWQAQYHLPQAKNKEWHKIPKIGDKIEKAFKKAEKKFFHKDSKKKYTWLL